MYINPNKYKLSTVKRGSKIFIQCLLRKKYIELTPEEFIRQIILNYINIDMNIPISRIAVEKGFEVNKRHKRFDAVIFDPNGNPYVLIECKKTGIELNENVVLQASNYNKVLKAPYLWLTNGANNRILEFKDEIYQEVSQINF